MLELRGKVRARGTNIGSVCKQVLIQILSVDELGGEGVRSETGPGAQNRALRDRLRILHSQLRVDREVTGKPGTGGVLEACGREPFRNRRGVTGQSCKEVPEDENPFEPTSQAIT